MDYKDPIEVAKQLLAEENEAVVDVVEAETILDLDDEQDTEGKKTKLDIGKGTEGKDKKNKASLNMKPSSASAKVEGAPSMTKEHLDALFTGEELSEDFKEKASTIFEAAISERAAQVELALNEQFEIAISEADYLGYVVEEWMKENELAVESGIRTEVAESFIHGLRELFESAYIDVPEEQYDLVDGLSTEVEDLREKLDAAINENIETTKEKDLAECSLVFEEETEGMLETDIDRLRTLAEGIEFDSVDQFREKLNILKESYSENSNTLTEETDVTTPDEGTEESISPMMEAYTRALRNPLTK